MPTATGGKGKRREGRQKREVYLGQANITFPSTAAAPARCHHNFSLLRRSRKRICDKTHSSRPHPIPLPLPVPIPVPVPAPSPLGPAGPWLGAVG